ncbi:enoyl-CoA hydratase-related protein [Alkalihalobacillus sp. AL-G]|uniref:enoyl-CoA hydratase-related protein n=1 Tax=Alkalihalobacillus sp. AL-G TaxID=2926399 RepID=UPI00272A8074|nr:enoyl-CoA hydratase-related protein [Alkalihalobacillus sp. AL-G]WLD94127.1 enoyl-CoA hydratase-related protein [Alkalihalobacillus sp. AL-G]
MYETIQYEMKNNVAWIKLNRPEKFNAFTEQMNSEITKALKEADRDKEVRCLVITGNGRAFSSGEDLAGVKQDTDHAEILRKRYNPMVKKLASVEKPVIAAVNGVAAGAGMSIALACDFRVLSEKASFIEAFINVGLVPDSGNLYYLPRLVGHAKALELAVMGEKITAEEAKDLGLATKVIPLDQWEEDVAAFAEHLAQKPTKAIGLIKRYLQKSWDSDLNEMLENEAYAQRTAGQTQDHAEGVQAFMEKRKPEFKGF